MTLENLNLKHKLPEHLVLDISENLLDEGKLIK
jgi:hypothetical protein